jgi:hypothetical protein
MTRAIIPDRLAGDRAMRFPPARGSGDEAILLSTLPGPGRATWREISSNINGRWHAKDSKQARWEVVGYARDA